MENKNQEKERLNAEIARTSEKVNRLNILKKKAQVRAFVKVLSLFVAVISLIVAIILDVKNSSYNILDLSLYAVFFLIIVGILGFRHSFRNGQRT